ncbi:MAG TPA: hypothetical protein VFZ77_09615 [Acidimicrobiales bacterium]
MSRPAPPGESVAVRLVVGIVLLLAAWIVIRLVLGTLYAIIRSVLFIALFAVVAWIVLVGPPGRRD